MTRLRAVIIDDEPLSRRALRQLLERRGDVEVVMERSHVVDLAPATLEADVVFLDIEMPERTGLQVAADWPTAGPALVFVTAFENYAPAAFDTEAVDYLTKPVTDERLDRALSRVRRRPPTAAPLMRLLVRVGDREDFVDLASIDAIEADGVYATLHTEGRRQLIRRSLDALARELPDALFLRVHRSWIVRQQAVMRMETARTSGAFRLQLASGLVVPVSRRRVAEVRRVLRSRP